jgi:uncharacterized protein YjdB
MLQFRHSYKTALTFVGASVALLLGCSDSVDPSIHGAPAVMVGPATQIQVAPSSTALSQGGRSLLRCAAFDAQGVMISSAPNWTSSDPSTAIVSSDGSITAVHPGTATATCQIGSRTATSSITVSTAQVAFVEVSPGAGTIPTGNTLQLSGVPRDSLGFPVPGVSVQWTSQDPTIATVTSDGVVAAKTTGDADIVATSAGVAGMTKVKVTGVPPVPVASILLNVDQTSLSGGHFTFATATTLDASAQALSGRAITWSTSDPTVLSVVTLNGTKAKVNARKQGTATVTATSEGKSASVTVTVGAPTVAVVAASLASPSIFVGQNTLASAIPEDGFGNPLSGHAVTWASLDPTIATVSAGGVVTGVAAGAVIIRATSDGVTGDASLTVTAVPVASVTTTLGSSTLTAGQTTQGTAIARDAGGNMLTGRSVAWSSLNTAVATVSISGLVTAMAPGNAVIRATVESRTGDVTVIVNAPAAPVPPAPTTASVVVTFDSSSIAKGHSAQAKATAKDGQGNVLSGKSASWVSTTTGVASVSGTGVVTGTNAGTAVIQATIDGVPGSGSLPVVNSATTTPPQPPPPPTTTSVQVSFDSSSIAVGHTSQARAVALDAQGHAIAGKVATWHAMDGFASVDLNTGVVTGKSAGTATIQATIDGISASGQLLVTPASVITAPAPSGSISANFDDGTFGPLFNPWGTGIDVIGDPTNLGHGRVARIHFQNNPSVGYIDDDKALAPSSPPSISLGQEMWFQGDFYLDPTARMDASGPNTVQRKLLYWGGHGPADFSTVLSSFGPQFYIGHTPVDANSYQYIDPSIVTLTAGAWHRLKVQLRMNSSFGATDGILRIWIDGTLMWGRTNMTWTDPTVWAGHSASEFQWNGWGVGYQVNASSAVNEYRYWDNVIFSSTPIP